MRWRGAGVGASQAIWCLVMFGMAAVPRAQAQTPSPLQEWQYPGGVVLEKLFEPSVPEWRAVLGGAVAVKPLYDGARPYHVQAGPVINIRYRDIAFASIGEGVGVNLLRGDNYRAGITIGYDLGRRASDYPSHLHGLGNIAPAPVAKLFASYVVSKSFPLVLRADVRRVLGGSDGWIGDVEAYLPLPGSSRSFVMFAGPSVTFADARYMGKVFGVGVAQSFASGYPVYKAHAGVTAAGLGFSATWFMTDHWLCNVDAAVNRLFGSAAQSPITESSTQGALTLAIAYRW